MAFGRSGTRISHPVRQLCLTGPTTCLLDEFCWQEGGGAEFPETTLSSERPLNSAFHSRAEQLLPRQTINMYRLLPGKTVPLGRLPNQKNVAMFFSLDKFVSNDVEQARPILFVPRNK
jgi:hypothetical protein